MTAPAFVIVPVWADGAQQTDQDTNETIAKIQQSLNRTTNPEDHKEPERNGPLWQIIANQKSLYKYRYISWEDPIRTLGSYISALAILSGVPVHYLPLTQYALKVAMTILGLVTVTEFASRSFSADSFSTRLRPKEYKKVPEPILNATLKDIHDLIQYVIVQAQRIVFGQDLAKTFATFLACDNIHWIS